MYNLDILGPLGEEATLNESGGQRTKSKNLQVIFTKLIFKAMRMDSLGIEFKERRGSESDV